MKGTHKRNSSENIQRLGAKTERNRKSSVAFNSGQMSARGTNQNSNPNPARSAQIRKRIENRYKELRNSIGQSPKIDMKSASKQAKKISEKLEKNEASAPELGTLKALIHNSPERLPNDIDGLQEEYNALQARFQQFKDQSEEKVGELISEINYFEAQTKDEIELVKKFQESEEQDKKSRSLKSKVKYATEELQNMKNVYKEILDDMTVVETRIENTEVKKMEQLKQDIQTQIEDWALREAEYIAQIEELENEGNDETPRPAEKENTAINTEEILAEIEKLKNRIVDTEATNKGIQGNLAN